MFWWWPLYDRYPVRILFFGVGLLVALLLIASIPLIIGDFRHYPEEVKGAYEGGALFFPFIVAYLAIGVPHLLFEQRRQVLDVVTRMRLNENSADRFEQLLVGRSRSFSIFSLLMGTILTLLYMSHQDMMIISGLSAEEELRRLIYFIMPMVMWTFYVEAMRVMLRSAQVMKRLIQKFHSGVPVHRHVMLPVVRVFVNNALFMAFGMSGVPLLWFTSHHATLDVVFFTVQLFGTGIYLTIPLLAIARRLYENRQFQRPGTLDEEGTTVNEDEEAVHIYGAFDDAMFTRVATPIIARMLPRYTDPYQLGMVVLFVRFWFVMFLPMFIWGVVWLSTWSLEGVF